MTVDLRHLRCLVAIADEGTVTAAAARLHVTQPALSRTLRQLETHLGVRLVDRSTHHLALTPAGRTFRDRAVAVLTAVDDLLTPQPAAQRPLRLGHAWSALGEHTTALLRRWRETYPDVPLELLRFDERTAGLGRGRVDIVLVREPVELPGVVTEALSTEARIAAVAADSPLAERAALALADLAGHPVAMNTVSGTTSLDMCPPGAGPTTTVRVRNTDDWLAAIAAGRAVGVTSTATAAMHPHPGVRYLPLVDAPSLTVRLAWPHPPTHPSVPDLVAVARAVVS